MTDADRTLIGTWSRRRVRIGDCCDEGHESEVTFVLIPQGVNVGFGFRNSGAAAACGEREEIASRHGGPLAAQILEILGWQGTDELSNYLRAHLRFRRIEQLTADSSLRIGIANQLGGIAWPCLLDCAECQKLC